MDSSKTLQEAIEAYKQSYGQEPKYRHVLAALEQAMHAAQRLTPQGGASPGSQAALKAASPIPPGSSGPPRTPERPQAAPGSPGSRWPVDFTSARQAAAERLSEAQSAA